MKVILFGATGMVGSGVLRECLLDKDVTEVLSVVRSPSGQTHAKLREIVHLNFYDYSSVQNQLKGFDACFFCLGVSSAGMSEAQYTHLTYDLTMTAAKVLSEVNSNMTFVYVSGAGTDSSEKGRSMWARVKGATENAILKMPFKAAFMFRPGFIQPMHGIKSKTKLYRIIYALTTPLYPVLKVLAPNQITTTEQVGRAMLTVARQGAAKKWLDSRDIIELSKI